jgi:hypothetical protein
MKKSAFKDIGIYPLGGKIVVWIKQKYNDIVRLENSNWIYSLYVAADAKFLHRFKQSLLTI